MPSWGRNLFDPLGLTIYYLPSPAARCWRIHHHLLRRATSAAPCAPVLRQRRCAAHGLVPWLYAPLVIDRRIERPLGQSAPASFQFAIIFYAE